MSAVSHPITRRAVASWVTYDLANTIFSMGVISLFFPHFVERAVGPEQVGRTFGIIQSISYAIIFLLSPLLGAMTDRARRRMPFLVWSTILCVGATAFIGRGSFLASAVLFILANAAYQGGLQFYDALIVEVTTEQNRGRVGGIGVGIGYMGSVHRGRAGLRAERVRVPIAPGFLAVVRVDCRVVPGAVDSLLPVRPRTGQSESAAGVRSGHDRALGPGHGGHVQVRPPLPGLVRFLIGRVFYTAAINTVIGFMALYTMHVSAASGLTESDAATQKNLVMAVAITFAVPAGFVWGHVTDRLGPKRTLDLVLYLWMATFALASGIGGFGMHVVWLYVVASMAGIAMAGTWAADRPGTCCD